MWRYTGEGRTLPGAPARDLTDEEFAVLPEDVQANIPICGIYEKAGETRRARSRAEAVEASNSPVEGEEGRQ